MIQSVADLLDPRCQDTSFLQPGQGTKQRTAQKAEQEAEQNIFSVLPMMTVVRPWCGRHHVYSIFAVPNHHHPRESLLLTVKGIGQYRRDIHIVMSQQNYPTQSGYYIVRTYLRTRLALFLICQGLYWKLQNPNNWILSYRLAFSEKNS